MFVRMIDGMDTPHWKVLGRRTIYDSSWVRLHRDDVQLPDGTVIDGHHVVDVPLPAVAVVPVGDDGRILMIEHYRFITETTGWEVPAGRFDAGEDVHEAASRELVEETGYSAASIEHLGHYFPSNGLSNQVFHLCIGRGLSRRGEIQDTNEVIQIGWFDRPDILRMIREGKVKDGLSLSALLRFFLPAE